MATEIGSTRLFVLGCEVPTSNRELVFIASAMCAALIAAIAYADTLPRDADPCEWLEYSVCHIQTGEEAHNVMGLSGHRLTGEGAIRNQPVMQVYRLADTKECVMIMSASGNTAAIKGTYRQVMKRLSKEGCKQ